jgi:hypothetical protein
MDEVLATALHKFFHTLKIKARSVIFLLLDDTIIKKTGKKIPGCSWYKDHAQNLANVFGHQWVLAALFYNLDLAPKGAHRTSGANRFFEKFLAIYTKFTSSQTGKELFS